MQDNTYTPIDHNFHVVSSDRLIAFEKTRSKEYNDYRRMWHEYPKTKYVSFHPMHLDIDITNRCNLKCTMCPRTDLVRDGKFWEEQDFSLFHYTTIINMGVLFGLKSVKFNILGEPLLHPELPNMIKIAKALGVVDTMLNTNATLLTKDMSYSLINSGLDKLFFSFDSPYRDKYNSIRVGANFYKVLNNIRLFMEIRDCLYSVTPLTRMSMVYMKENKEEWEEFQLKFSPLVDFVAKSIYLDHSNQNTNKTAVKLGERDKKFCCPQLWQRMFIHADGEIAVCCIDTARDIKIGNIRNGTVIDFWRGDKYTEIRKLHKEGRYEEIPTCRECPMARYKEEE